MIQGQIRVQGFQRRREKVDQIGVRRRVLGLRVVLPSPAILCPGREIFVKLPFHTAAHVMGVAPCRFRVRLGLLLVLCEVVSKRNPVGGSISEIGLDGFRGPVRLSGHKSGKGGHIVRLDLCDKDVDKVLVFRIDDLKVPGPCSGK